MALQKQRILRPQGLIRPRTRPVALDPETMDSKLRKGSRLRFGQNLMGFSKKHQQQQQQQQRQQLKFIMGHQISRTRPITKPHQTPNRTTTLARKRRRNTPPHILPPSFRRRRFRLAMESPPIREKESRGIRRRRPTRLAGKHTLITNKPLRRSR